MLTPRQYLQLLQRAAQAWVDDNAPSMGAAIAFYSAFALAPVLLLGASSVMQELRHDLDIIWKADPLRTGFWAAVRDGLLSLVLILAAGALLLASLIGGTVLNALVYRSPRLHQHALALHLLHLLLTLIIFSLLFAMLFKWLPNVRLGWREAWRGAFVTALLFTVGQLGIGYYLGRSSTTSAYAAAASLLVLLRWLYYAARIFLFGAELVHAQRVAAARDEGALHAHRTAS